MAQVHLATVLRHPLASKRCLMVYRQNEEETTEVFELLSRYEAVGPIGHGTYGFVCSVRDNDLVDLFGVNPPEEYQDPSASPEEREEIYDAHTLVAVKKLRQLFENNQPRMWLCATREIQLMMAFRHDNVMSATDFFIPLGSVDMMTYEAILSLRASFDSVYVVMKKMDYTLREVLDSTEVEPAFAPPDEAASGDKREDEGTPVTVANAFSSPTTIRIPLHPLQQDYRKFILYQIFRGVGYLHLCPVIHRDLKPENIMLDRNYNVMITDFGQGRDVGVGAEYVQTVLDNCTQWYAAPETLTLAVASSTGFIDHESFHGVDVWSIGCIAAEMLMGRPLFFTPSIGGFGQLHAVLSVLGPPTEAAVSSITEYRDANSKEIFGIAVDRAAAKYQGRVSCLRELLHSPYEDDDEDEVALIEACLAWDPRQRINIQTALESPYFTKDGYDPVIDPDDTAKRVRSVRPDDISDAVNGRAFLWDLFVQRHPEVGELWNSLVRKHQEEEEEAAKAK